MPKTVTVGTSLATLLIYECLGLEYIGFKIENDDGAALNNFQFQVKMSSVSILNPMYSNPKHS
jgi:hypothetical protein